MRILERGQDEEETSSCSFFLSTFLGWGLPVLLGGVGVRGANCARPDALKKRKPRGKRLVKFLKCENIDQSYNFLRVRKKLFV